MLKRLACSLGLCGLLCAACAVLSTPAGAADYTDIQGHWAADVIEKWSDAGILSGYADGTFRPDAPVTRAQLATVLYRIWGAEPVEDGFDYPDLPRDLWCYDAVNTMNMYEVAPNTGGQMLPDHLLTREEAFYMIGRGFLMGINPLSRKDVFDSIKDADDISPQYVTPIKWLVIDHYVNGSADGRLNPKRGITRAEVMKIIDNIVDVYITEPGVYPVHAKQNVLITCGGVTLQRTDVPAGFVSPYRTSYVRNFLFGSDAAEGGVTFENHMSGDQTSKFYLYSVSQNPPSYHTGNRVELKTQRVETLVASTHVFPDTRFDAGYGSRDYPYLISSADQFRLLAECQDHTPLGYKSFRLTRDVDLGTLSAPLGEQEADHQVFAYLDGGGHTVSYRMKNAFLEETYGGLFYYWGGGCSHLNLKGTAEASFSEQAKYYVSGHEIPKKTYDFGGFSGYFGGDVENCTTSVDVTVRYPGNDEKDINVGGWAGNARGNYLDCTASGTVRAVLTGTVSDAHVGGLLGSAASGLERRYQEIKTCGAEGTVSVQGGSFTMAGGLVGHLSSNHNTLDPHLDQENYGMVNCWSTAAVSGSGASFQCEAGGLVGQLYAGAIQQCWAKPTVSVNGGSYQNIGAIAASCRAMASISDCWANASGLASGGDLHAGGITGRLDQGTVSNCYTLGAAALGDGNAIAYQSWNDGTVTASTDMTGIAPDARAQFLKTCGWDLAAVWDASGTDPLLRGCDRDAQLAAQR